MKRFAIVLLAVIGLVGGIGVAGAQTHGGSRGGGTHAGGQWHSGGNWSGGGSWSRSGGNWHGGGWHGSRVFVGVGFGAPWLGWGWWPGYYPAYYPYYAGYYPAYPYAVDYPYGYEYGYESMAPSYVQKDAPAYDQQGSGQRGQYQYYCPDPAGYYPQVATCARGWLRVVPPSAPGPAAPVQR
jgi:hypothetical protein